MRLCIVICVLFLTSCQSKKIDDRYEIISILFDKYSRVKVKPPLPGKNFDLTEKEIDSIRKQKQNILVYPLFDKLDFKGDYKMDDFDKFDQELLSKISSISSEPLLSQKINNPLGHSITLLDTLKLQEDRRYISKNFDKFLKFYQISFSDNGKEAITVISHSNGYLNGATLLIYLIKIDGSWQIRNSKLLSIS